MSHNNPHMHINKHIGQYTILHLIDGNDLLT